MGLEVRSVSFELSEFTKYFNVLGRIKIIKNIGVTKVILTQFNISFLEEFFENCLTEL